MNNRDLVSPEAGNSVPASANRIGNNGNMHKVRRKKSGLVTPLSVFLSMVLYFFLMGFWYKSSPEIPQLIKVVSGITVPEYAESKGVVVERYLSHTTIFGFPVKDSDNGLIKKILDNRYLTRDVCRVVVKDHIISDKKKKLVMMSFDGLDCEVQNGFDVDYLYRTDNYRHVAPVAYLDKFSIWKNICIYLVLIPVLIIVVFSRIVSIFR